MIFTNLHFRKLCNSCMTVNSGERRKFPRGGKVSSQSCDVTNRGYAPGIVQNYKLKHGFLCILGASFSIMLLRDLLAGETENWTFVV